MPEYTTGDECLFCHRNDVGPGWKQNRHARTVRPAEEEPAAVAALKKTPGLEGIAEEVKLVLGGAKHLRFLKPAAAAGKLELLDVAGRRWDGKQFGDGCAGCHATAVDPQTRSFATVALDCYVCHGDVPGKHTTDQTLVHLSKARKDPARVVVSVCGQCHLRTGTAKSTGLPYPNNFVAGDNLFRDFRVDFADAALRQLNPADAHVLHNVRDVVLGGRDAVTCLSCHDVHRQSARKHHRVAKSDLCLHCHHADRPKSVRKEYEVHSKVCGY